MRTHLALSRLRWLLPLLAVLISPMEARAAGGVGPETELYRTIAALDAALFDAYNRCDLEKLGSLVAEDLEFYHDKTGLSRSRASFVEAVKNNICGKVRRELVAGTLEVHPLEGYGAMEMGVHRFSHPGRDDVEPLGEAQFIQLWQNQNGVWRLTRVISYDHHALPK